MKKSELRQIIREVLTPTNYEGATIKGIFYGTDGWHIQTNKGEFVIDKKNTFVSKN